MVTAIIAAGGKGTRMGADINKIFLPLGAMEIISRTISAFENCPRIDETVVVTAENDLPILRRVLKKYGFKKLAAIVAGGSTRAESVRNGLNAASGDIVLIHDGARPLITEDEILRVIDDCEKYGAAALGVKCKDTLKKSDADGFIETTLDRETTYQIQTPQAFYRKDILRAHSLPGSESATDDCALAERAGIKIKITEGSYENIKLTTPSDIIIGEEILRRRTQNADRPGL